MVAKGGHSLLDKDSIECLEKELFPKKLSYYSKYS